MQRFPIVELPEIPAYNKGAAQLGPLTTLQVAFWGPRKAIARADPLDPAEGIAEKDVEFQVENGSALIADPPLPN